MKDDLINPSSKLSGAAPEAQEILAGRQAQRSHRAICAYRCSSPERAKEILAHLRRAYDCYGCESGGFSTG